MATGSGRLFDACTDDGTLHLFTASGYGGPVAGTVFGRGVRPTLGMPLGGVATGCLDLAADGTLGFCTIFGSHVPRRGPLNAPVLGFAIQDRTWVLSTRQFAGADLPGAHHGYRDPGQLRFADDIEYWGHYPIADLNFALDAPISASVRAWAPFLPGDAKRSNLPVAFFDVHLTNRAPAPITGTVAFSFPGPTEAEVGGLPLRRRPLLHRTVEHGDRSLTGVEVSGQAAGYVIGVVDRLDTRTGGELGVDGGAWRRIGLALPHAGGSTGASAAASFSLGVGDSTVVSFVLAWRTTRWCAAGNPDPAALATLPWYADFGTRANQTGTRYLNMYAARFGDAVEVALAAVGERDDLLARTLAWQGEIYGDPALPAWLQDGLINSLHLITETSFWAAAHPPIGDWCREEDGIFGLMEDPRHCPQIECVPCSFYGNYPLVLFFPELARATLRAYRAYQFENGEVAWIFGGMTGQTKSLPCELTSPDRGYQTTLNGPCVVDMVFRYWLVTGDLETLRELYPMVRRSVEFTVGLRPEDGADGIISFPTGNTGLEWFEACSWAGMAAHVGGIHLAELRQGEALAAIVGDDSFANQCREWFTEGSTSMEEKMWTGTYYVNFWDQASGEKSELVMANQLDGEWMTRLSGLAGVFRHERVGQTLDTVERTCVGVDAHGPVNFADTDGRPTTSGEGRPGWDYDPHAYFVPEALMLAMTYLYAGRAEVGLDLAERVWSILSSRGLLWDQPNLISALTGEAIFGGDYYQNMIIWAFPAALAGRGLGALTEEGGLAARVIHAATLPDGDR